jgi:hypothetical protein
MCPENSIRSVGKPNGGLIRFNKLNRYIVNSPNNTNLPETTFKTHKKATNLMMDGINDENWLWMRGGQYNKKFIKTPF